MEKYYDACGAFHSAMSIWIRGAPALDFTPERIPEQGRNAHERLNNPEIRKRLSRCVAKLYEADLEGQVGTVEDLPTPEEVLDFDAYQTGDLIRDLMKRYFKTEMDSDFNFNYCLQYGE